MPIHKGSDGGTAPIYFRSSPLTNSSSTGTGYTAAGRGPVTNQPYPLATTFPYTGIGVNSVTLPGSTSGMTLSYRTAGGPAGSFQANPLQAQGMQPPVSFPFGGTQLVPFPPFGVWVGPPNTTLNTPPVPVSPSAAVGPERASSQLPAASTASTSAVPVPTRREGVHDKPTSPTRPGLATTARVSPPSSTATPPTSSSTPNASPPTAKTTSWTFKNELFADSQGNNALTDVEALCFVSLFLNAGFTRDVAAALKLAKVFHNDSTYRNQRLQKIPRRNLSSQLLAVSSCFKSPVTRNGEGACPLPHIHEHALTGESVRIAAHIGNYRVLSHLHNSFESLIIQEWGTVVTALIDGNHVDVAMKVLGWYPDEVKNTDALHVAARCGRTKLILRLCAPPFSVDVNKVLSMYERTPLHWAAEEGCAEAVRCLLQVLGINPNVVAAKGWTPLHLAVICSKPGANETIEALVSHPGINVDARDAVCRRTPLHCLCECAPENIIALKLLMSANCDINAKDRFGRTPLHILAEHPDPGRALIMLEALAANNSKEGCADRTARGGSSPRRLNMTAVNDDGQSALDVAIAQNGLDSDFTFRLKAIIDAQES